LAILLGAEGPGLPTEVLEQADERLRIPMTGTPESLNLSVAAGVMLYEVRRQITAASEVRSSLGVRRT
jgi:tRNA G18 (ribose-2'-O)-methylase SpoU